MALINDKDAKAVRERLAKLPGRVIFAIFTQELECEYCRANPRIGGGSRWIIRGQSHDRALLPSGACARLFTGSPMAPGADAVVMQEETRVMPEEPGMVLVLEPVERGENVRQRGEDVKRGAAWSKRATV